MPTYEYRCQKCAHGYEKREGFHAPARQRCPKCGGSARRVLHPAPIVFKGSGFYVTDNRSSSRARHGGDGAKGEEKPDKPSTAGRPAEVDADSATSDKAAAG